MVAPLCSYEDQQWSSLLEDRLSQAESSEMTHHLERCPSCRNKFEMICASSQSWQESSVVLRKIGRESIAVAQLMTEGKPAAKEGANSLSRPISKELSSAVLSWLTATDDPQALGDLEGYSVREVVGYGGMGTVLRAWDKVLCRMVAIKILHPHLASNGTARNRFAREAQSVAGIAHPNVVPVHAVAADHQPPYIVMGYVAGGSLQDRIDREGALSLEESLRIAMQIAEGLTAAHAQGLVHRDIKPANLMLESTWQRVLITDFGLARALDDASFTASGLLAGTPQFMSPEQARGDAVDARSDLFSLGSVLYTMLVGHPPFRAESAVAVLRRVTECQYRPVHTLQEHLPLWVHRLLERFLDRNVESRIGSAEEASHLLKQTLQHVSNPSAFPLPSVLASPRAKARITAKHVWIAGGLLVAGFLFGMNLERVQALLQPILADHAADRSHVVPAIPGNQTDPSKDIQDPVTAAKQVRDQEAWGDNLDRQLELLEIEVEVLRESLRIP